MSPDVVMGQPRFIRTFLLMSMEVQLEAEAEQAAAAARNRQQLQNSAPTRGRRRR